MTDATVEAGAANAPRKKGKSRALLVAAVLALLAGGGGFYAVWSGLLDSVLPGAGATGGAAAGAAKPGAGNGAIATAGSFVAMKPMIISLGPDADARHLKVTLTAEVEKDKQAEIETEMPRIVDTLQGFLRAVDERTFEDPRAMERLRAQMLRRVRLVTPPDSVRDLLIQDFLLN